MIPPLDTYAEARRRFMPIPEVARELGISVSHCYDLARQEALPFPVTRLGTQGKGTYKVLRSDVERYLAGQDEPAPNQTPTATPLSVVALTHLKGRRAVIDWQIKLLEREVAADQHRGAA